MFVTNVSYQKINGGELKLLSNNNHLHALHGYFEVHYSNWYSMKTGNKGKSIDRKHPLVYLVKWVKEYHCKDKK